MSEIQRYMYARDGMVPDAEHLRGSGEPEFWVRFTDHEAERAENLATIDFLNKELRSAVDALADAEARIEGLVHKEQGFDNADMEYGYGRGLAESIRALAALTQPQTEKCPDCASSSTPGHIPCDYCRGKGIKSGHMCQRCHNSPTRGTCPTCHGRGTVHVEDAANGKTEKGCCEVRAWTGECSPGCPNYGGGAATAAGVADAEHERRLETNRLLWNRVARLEEALRVIRGPEDRGPWMLIYRNAGGGYAGLQAIAETALAPEDSEPSPYAKAFREKFPVPEFPGIKNRQEDQA